MLRTNSKKAIENIRAYIRDSITAEDAQSRIEEFNENAYHHRNYNDEPTLGEWLVDSCCEFEVYFDDQREAIRKWLEETPEQAAQYSDDAVHALYCSLLAREFVKVFGYVKQCSRSKYNECVFTYRKEDES